MAMNRFYHLEVKQLCGKMSVFSSDVFYPFGYNNNCFPLGGKIVLIWKIYLRIAICAREDAGLTGPEAGPVFAGCLIIRW